MQKKLALLLLVSFFLVFMVGCWSRKEVENLAIGTVIGIDKVEIQGQEKYRFTIKIIRTGELGLGTGGGTGTERMSAWVATGLGETPFEAGRNLATRSPRRVFLAHSTFIIIGEKVAKEGVQGILDALLRHRDVRLRNYIVVTKGEASELLNAEPELETLLVEELLNLTEITRPMVSKAVAVDLKDFAANLALHQRDIAVGKLERFIPPEKANKNELEHFFGEDPEEAGGHAIRVTGSAIFKKDKLVGYMGDWETSGLLHILGEYERGAVPVKESGIGKFDLEITRSESNVKSKVEGEEITFDIEINVEGDFIEHLVPHEEGLTPENIVAAEKDAARVIQTQIDGAIKIAQEDFGADIFGLGEKLRRQNNKEWKKVKENWREVFPEVKINAKVEVNIRRTGLISDTLKIE